jgi:hypothetical protein
LSSGCTAPEERESAFLRGGWQQRGVAAAPDAAERRDGVEQPRHIPLRAEPRSLFVDARDQSLNRPTRMRVHAHA